MRLFLSCLLVSATQALVVTKEGPYVHTSCDSSMARPTFYNIHDHSERVGPYSCHFPRQDNVLVSSTEHTGELCGTFNGVVCCKVQDYGWMPAYHKDENADESNGWYKVGQPPGILPAAKRHLATACDTITPDTPTAAPTGSPTTQAPTNPPVNPTNPPTTGAPTTAPASSDSNGALYGAIGGSGFLVLVFLFRRDIASFFSKTSNYQPMQSPPQQQKRPQIPVPFN